MGCLWDTDTLKDEGKGLIDEVKVIVGWFDRYPPEYYQARLDRVLLELKAAPGNLPLYDDAAVSLDRLHRSDEAIEMMAQKKSAMEKLKSEEGSQETLWEHQYRYLANLGTFHVHRWISRNKEERDTDLTDLKTAEDLIAKAITHNPDAHFGREKYQLLAIQWLQKKPDEDKSYLRGPFADQSRMERDNAAALKGFLGMIKLGSAWESFDFFNIVAEILVWERHGRLGHLASLRAEELHEAGRSSLHPESVLYPRYGGGVSTDRKKQDKEWFGKARKAADERQSSRWEYLRKGLANGRHPDTHPDFWNEWEEPEFPALPGLTLQDLTSPQMLLKTIFFTTIALLVLLWAVSFYIRRRKTLASKA